MVCLSTSVCEDLWYTARTMESLFVRQREEWENLRLEAWEHGLPGYLQQDLDAYKKGLSERSSRMDCLWGELSGSINGAEIDDQAITHEHAEYLRLYCKFS